MSNVNLDINSVGNTTFHGNWIEVFTINEESTITIRPEGLDYSQAEVKTPCNETVRLVVDVLNQETGAWEEQYSGFMDWSSDLLIASFTLTTEGFLRFTFTIMNRCGKANYVFLGPTAVEVDPCDGSLAVAVTTLDHVTCFEAENGVIGVTVTGGTAPYTYLWSNGNTTISVNPAPAGIYDLTVTDANGCVATLPSPVEVLTPEKLLFTYFVAGNTGEPCNGSIHVHAIGGTVPYNYTFEQGPTIIQDGPSNALSGICNGTYQVTVTDANGCKRTETVIVS